MIDSTEILHCVARLRPRAKFVHYSHSSDFIDEQADLRGGFHYINLYDEEIDSCVIPYRNDVILIHNTYLSSFAYNLFLAWIYAGKAGAMDNGEMTPLCRHLIKHNFKKFFAEQLLRKHNNIFARAVLLETLLYEEACMVPVFNEKASNSAIDDLANIAANLISSMVSFHELGHFYFRKIEGMWDSVYQEHLDILNPLYSQIPASYPVRFIEELRCDTLAVISCLNQYGPLHGIAFTMRAVLFSYATFAVLVALNKSAETTGEEHAKTPDQVDLRSIKKQHREYTYRIGVDHDFNMRVSIVTKLCEAVARKHDFLLYDKVDDFRIHETIAADLLCVLNDIMESDDRNAREKSMLVAEAFEGHEQGIEYLYLRSKTFQSQRAIPDRV